MIVAAGFHDPVDAEDAVRHDVTRRLYQELGGYERHVGEGARVLKRLAHHRNIRIPAGQAVIIIGGRYSIYDELNKSRDLKFVSQDGAPLTISASLGGTKAGAAARYVGMVAKTGAMMAVVPTGVNAAVRKGAAGRSFGKQWAAELKAYGGILASPSKFSQNVTRASRSMTAVQIMSGQPGRADQVWAAPGSDISVSTVFNKLLHDGHIERAGAVTYMEEYDT